MELIATKTGCIAHLVDGYENVQTEVHHLTAGFRRRGHGATIGLCPWHHRGVLPGWAPNSTVMEFAHGPSFARGRRAFEDRYGSDAVLLSTQNYALSLYEEEPWGDLEMPREAAAAIRRMWHSLMVRRSN